MKLIILGIGLFIAAYGLMEFIKPGRFCDLARRFDSLTGLYSAAVFRIVFGGIMVYVGPETAFPEFLQILGYIVIVAGVILLFLGYARFHKIMEWWCGQSPNFFRSFAVFAILFGGFLAYAVMD